MGHRMEILCDPAAAPDIIAVSKSFGIDAQVVGRTEANTASSTGANRLILRDGKAEFEYTLASPRLTSPLAYRRLLRRAPQCAATRRLSPATQDWQVISRERSCERDTPRGPVPAEFRRDGGGIGCGELEGMRSLATGIQGTRPGPGNG